MSKYKIIILCIIISIFLVILILNRIIPLQEYWNNLWLKEIKVKFQTYEKYEINLDALKEYKNIKDGTQFTYYLHLASSSRDNAIIEIIINMELSEELLNIIADNNKSACIIFTFGRELIEFKYKYEGPYKYLIAMITLGEEYQNDTMYIYFLDEPVYVFMEECYIMDGSKKIKMGSIENLNK